MRALGWALAATALFGLAALVLVLAVGALSSDTADVTDLDVGDCFDLAPDDEGAVGLVDVIDCDELHNAEVVAIAELNPTGDQPYPADDELFAIADAACSGVQPDPRFGVLAVAPTEATWDGRRGRVICVALVYGDGETDLPYGSPSDA